MLTFQNNDLTIRDTLKGTVDWLTAQSKHTEPQTQVKPETLDFLNLHVSQLTAKIENIKERIKTLDNKIENQFSDMKQVGYRLHSVFIHRGQATFGHYWIYIRDFKNNVYRMYNDQTIKEVPESEIFSDNEENTATPYFLVFIRADLADKLVDSVVRDVADDDEEISFGPSANDQLSGQTKASSSFSQASTVVASSEPSSGSANVEKTISSIEADPMPPSYAQIAAMSAVQGTSPSPTQE